MKIELVDGDRDKPAGKSAENWSRRDGIRAGAVSGPWRSTPRASRPSIEPASEPAPAEPPTPVRPVVHPPRPARLPVAVWVALGCLLAVCCVLAALALRPDAPDEATAAEPAATATAATQITAPLVPIGPVRLRISQDMPSPRRDALLAALAAAGVADVQVDALPFAIESARVGYYLAPDREAAEALAHLAAPLVTPGRTLAVRDYAKLIDDPAGRPHRPLGRGVAGGRRATRRVVPNLWILGI